MDDDQIKSYLINRGLQVPLKKIFQPMVAQARIECKTDLEMKNYILRRILFANESFSMEGLTAHNLMGRLKTNS